MRFEEESKDYQGFGVLKQTGAEGRISLLGTAIVERGEDGRARAKEGVATGAARCDQSLLDLIEGEVRGA